MDRNEAECHRQTSLYTFDGNLEDFLILQRMPPKQEQNKNQQPTKTRYYQSTKMYISV